MINNSAATGLIVVKLINYSAAAGLILVKRQLIYAAELT
jgi:hypothetical protein